MSNEPLSPLANPTNTGNALYKDNMVSSTFSELYHDSSTAAGDNSTAYDKLNRLTAFRRGTLTAPGNNVNGNGTSLFDTVTVGNLNSRATKRQSWTLDVLGNQTSVSTDGTAAGNTVNSRNQKTVVNGTNITFDNNGNALTGVGGAGTLTYDAWGDELTSATCSTSRTYDALGRIAILTSPDNFSGYSITKQHDLYYTNKWQEAQDTATWNCGCTCSTDTEQYVWGAGYVDDLVLRDRTPDSSATARLYVQQDANFNVTAITDTSGAVQERFVFAPYGQETTLNANWSNAASSFGQFNSDSNAWIYGFQGWRYDTGTGFYTVRNRDYEVVFGWVGADPTGGMYIDGMNLYQVERSNPPRFVDPSGLSHIALFPDVHQPATAQIAPSAAPATAPAGPATIPAAPATAPAAPATQQQTKCPTTQPAPSTQPAENTAGPSSAILPDLLGPDELFPAVFDVPPADAGIDYLLRQMDKVTPPPDDTIRGPYNIAGGSERSAPPGK